MYNPLSVCVCECVHTSCVYLFMCEVLFLQLYYSTCQKLLCIRIIYTLISPPPLNRRFPRDGTRAPFPGSFHWVYSMQCFAYGRVTINVSLLWKGVFIMLWNVKGILVWAQRVLARKQHQACACLNCSFQMDSAYQRGFCLSEKTAFLPTWEMASLTSMNNFKTEKPGSPHQVELAFLE